MAYVDDVRAFIPASQLSTEYVEKLEDWQGKNIDVIVITADTEKKRLVLSGREVEKERKEAERKEKLAQFKAGDVVEGTVDSLKNYGAFIKLATALTAAARFPDQHPAHQTSGRCAEGRPEREGEDPVRCGRKDQPEHEGADRAGGG